MDHHLNRRVIFSEDSEFKSLYNWSLQELDEEGAKIGRDMIPWDWSLNFTATELTYSDGLAIEPDYGAKETEPKKVAQRRRHIRAKMRPGTPHEWHRNRQTSYSMFGTDRTISDFELFIEPLEDREQEARFRVWGSVSYTMDIDFQDETTDDVIVFYLYIQPDAFERYVNTVKTAQVDHAVLFVRRVEGFYSEWSPSISTNNIKVLTGYEKEHLVEVAEDSEVVLPRLGDVGEVSFTMLRKLTLENKVPLPAQDDDWLAVNEFAEAPPDIAMIAAQSSAKANIQAVVLLSALRTAAWVIALLLLLNLLTKAM